MKVLHLITSLDIGGAEKLVLDIVKKTASYSTVCALYGNCKIVEDLNNPNFEIVKLHRKNKFNPLIIFSIYKLIKRIKPDIVHTHLIHATLYGRIAAVLAGIRIILTTEHNASNWQRKYLLIHLLYRLTVKWNKKIFAVSKYVKERIIQIGKIKESKIIVLYNGTDINTFTDSSPNIYKKIEKYSKPLIGSVGRLIPIKGHQYFIEAAAEIIKCFSQATFLLLGGGELEFDLKKKATQIGIEKHIHFLGFQHSIFQYLKAMDVFVFPSIEAEGLPISLLEAMAYGVPVVATSVGSTPEIIKHQESGILVEPKDSNKIAKAVIALLKDPEKANQLQKHAKKIIIQQFDILLTVKNLENYYRQFLSDAEYNGVGFA